MAAKRYQKELLSEINADREAHGWVNRRRRFMPCCKALPMTVPGRKPAVS